MVTIYTTRDCAVSNNDSTEKNVLLDEKEERPHALVETFISMRRSLREDLKEVQISDWLIKSATELE